MESKKGKGGGYALSQPPASITLGRVIRAMAKILDRTSIADACCQGDATRVDAQATDALVYCI